MLIQEMVMIRDYWGEFGSGRLQTRRFLFLWILLVVAFILIGLAIGASIGVAEHLVGGNIAEAQATLRNYLSVPAIIVIVVLGILFLIAKLNIIAKRARDVGLPGWITAIVIAGLVGATSQYSDPQTNGGLGMILVLILAFIPTNALRRSAS